MLIFLQMKLDGRKITFDEIFDDCISDPTFYGHYTQKKTTGPWTLFAAMRSDPTGFYLIENILLLVTIAVYSYQILEVIFYKQRYTTYSNHIRL